MRLAARLATFISLLATPVAQAQSVADFYRGKTVTIIMGTAAGGSYDISARMMARHMGRHIPGNPNMVVQNMPGANAIIAANYVYNVAPQDGTVIFAGTRLVPFEPFFENANAKFDVTKVRWLGSTASEHGVVLAWHTAPHQTAADLFTKELVIGATVPGGDTYVYPTAMNRLLGTKFKIIGGYVANPPIGLAMENGEVQGSGNWSWSNIPVSKPQWLSEKKVRILLQLGVDRHPDLPDVPLATDFAKNDEQRDILGVLMGMKKLGYPFYAAPGVPRDRADALEKAFIDALNDPVLLGEAKREGRPIEPVGGAEAAAVIMKSYGLSPDLKKKAREVVQN